MASGLSAETFTKLLNRLDSDPDKAGDLYESLRRILLRYFEWRHTAFPEEHADEVLTRLAKKIAEGTEIRNVNSYMYEIARLVYLEAMKRNERKLDSLDTEHQEEEF